MDVINTHAFVVQFLLAGLKQQQALVVQTVHSLEAFAHTDGPTQRPHLDVELRFDFFQQVVGVFPFAVEFVDKGDDGRFAHAAHFHQLFGLDLHALHAVDHHHHTVNGREGAVGVFGKVLVAGSVEQVDFYRIAAVLVHKSHHRGGHRDAALLLNLHKVGGGVLGDLVRLHGPGRLDGPAEQQQLFGQRGFARIGVTDDAKGASLGYFFGEVAHGWVRILYQRGYAKCGGLVSRKKLMSEWKNGEMSEWLISFPFTHFLTHSFATSLQFRQFDRIHFGA